MPRKKSVSACALGEAMLTEDAHYKRGHVCYSGKKQGIPSLYSQSGNT